MTDLKTKLAGLPLRNPVVLASGPLSHDGAAVLRAFRSGVGAVVTKTIRHDAAHNPLCHIACLKSGLLNSEKWSELPAQRWIDQEIPIAKDGGALVIASVGANADEVRALAAPLADAGADALEVCSYEASHAVPMVEAAVSEAGIPVLAKISANWPDVVSIAVACRQAGAAAITAIDSVGPALRLDITQRAPRVGGGFGWLSGSPILALAMRVVADIAQRTDAPIVGTGGVSSASEIVEMMMAGASAVGICSHFMTAGLDTVAELLEAVGRTLEALGYDSVDSLVGAALPSIETAQTHPIQVPGPQSDDQFRPLFLKDFNRCGKCNRCVEVCPYEARISPDRVQTDRCRFCGLCVSACPTGALTLQTSP